MPIDPRWLDPSGWRPYQLQMSVPPEAWGTPFAAWQREQPLYDPVEMRIWVEAHDPDVPGKLKEVKKKKKTKGPVDTRKSARGS